MIANKLKKGDEIRVIAPSRSMSILSDKTIATAKGRLESLGFKVTFGKNVMNAFDENFSCASINDRVNDLHEAFLDKNVKAILTAIGGFNVNQILEYIDYNIIKDNPKIICGFSDITALTSAIYAKTGLVTYSGVHFSSFGMEKGFEYSQKYFEKIFIENDDEINVENSIEWSNDSWFIDQNNRNFISNKGMKIINKGQATGTIIGGNLCTLNLLQGTDYMPNDEDVILFIEDDGLVEDTFINEFDRNLQSLLQTSLGKNIKGIVVGRCEEVSDMNYEKWISIFKTKKQIQNIPIVIDSNFGHTTPIFTFPIGGKATLNVDNKIELKIYNVDSNKGGK